MFAGSASGARVVLDELSAAVLSRDSMVLFKSGATVVTTRPKVEANSTVLFTVEPNKISLIGATVVFVCDSRSRAAFNVATYSSQFTHCAMKKSNPVTPTCARMNSVTRVAMKQRLFTEPMNHLYTCQPIAPSPCCSVRS